MRTYDFCGAMLKRILRSKNGQWMTIKVTIEMKNAPTSLMIKSFLVDYLGDRSHLFRNTFRRTLPQ